MFSSIVSRFVSRGPADPAVTSSTKRTPSKKLSNIIPPSPGTSISSTDIIDEVQRTYQLVFGIQSKALNEEHITSGGFLRDSHSILCENHKDDAENTSSNGNLLSIAMKSDEEMLAEIKAVIYSGDKQINPDQTMWDILLPEYHSDGNRRASLVGAFSLSSSPPPSMEWHRMLQILRIIKYHLDLSNQRSTISSTCTPSPDKNTSKEVVSRRSSNVSNASRSTGKVSVSDKESSPPNNLSQAGFGTHGGMFMNQMTGNHNRSQSNNNHVISQQAEIKQSEVVNPVKVSNLNHNNNTSNLSGIFHHSYTPPTKKCDNLLRTSFLSQPRNPQYPTLFMNNGETDTDSDGSDGQISMGMLSPVHPNCASQGIHSPAPSGVSCPERDQYMESNHNHNHHRNFVPIVLEEVTPPKPSKPEPAEPALSITDDTGDDTVDTESEMNASNLNQTLNEIQVTPTKPKAMTRSRNTERKSSDRLQEEHDHNDNLNVPFDPIPFGGDMTPSKGPIFGTPDNYNNGSCCNITPLKRGKSEVDNDDDTEMADHAAKANRAPVDPLKSPEAPGIVTVADPAHSPPQLKVLLSARKAMTVARGRNLDAALLRSGRKIVKNVMPRAKKTKKCTPGVDRRRKNKREELEKQKRKIYSATPAVFGHSSWNDDDEEGEDKPFMIRQANTVKVAKQLEFSEDEDGDKRSSIGSINSVGSTHSHYGWKKDNNSVDAHSKDDHSVDGIAGLLALQDREEKMGIQCSWKRDSDHQQQHQHELSTLMEATCHRDLKNQSMDGKGMDISMLSHVLSDMVPETKDSESMEVESGPIIIGEMQQKIDELQMDITKKDVSIQGYENKLREKSERLRTLQQEMEEYRSKYLEFQRKCRSLDTIKEQNKAMEVKMKTLSEEHAATKKECDSMRQMMQGQREEYEAKCSNFCEELSKKENEIKAKESENIQIENDLKNAMAKLDYFKNRVSKMGKIHLLQSQLMRLSADYGQIVQTVKFKLQRTGQEFSCMADMIKTGLLRGPTTMTPSDFLNHDAMGDGDVSMSVGVSSFLTQQDSARETLKEAEKERDELKSNLLALNVSYQNEKRLRKKLLEEVIDLKGNIRVFCRVRPKISRVASANEASPELMATTCLDDERIGIFCDENASNKKEFSFDQVYKPDSNQDTIFEDVCPLIHSCVDGYNVCIFAYGQTGSGKTYTMEGTATNPGVIYQTFAELFRLKTQTLKESGTDSMQIWLSCLEIYNEKIRDLLPDKNSNVYKDSGINPCDLKAKLSQCKKKVLVPGLTKVEVVDTNNVRDILVNTAYKNRSTGTTNMNEHSSRSHALVFVEVVTAKTTSRLVLIDLAGSERVKKTGASGARFDEARSINKSLSALGNVISSLQRKDKHIPYRDSALTYLLHDCLGGNSKALMFCNISCELFDVKESINTLQFANRVRRVALGEAHKNDSPSSGVDAKEKNGNGSSSSSNGGGNAEMMKQKLKRMKKDLEDKEKEINHLKMNNRNCKKEITKLTSSIDAQSSKKANHHQTRMEFNNLQKEHSRLQQEVDKKEKQIKKLSHEVNEYKHKLKESQTNAKRNSHNNNNNNHHQIQRPRTALPSMSSRRNVTVNPRKRKMPSSNDNNANDNNGTGSEHQPALKRRKMINPGKHSRNAIKKPTVSRNVRRTRSKEVKSGNVPSYMAPTRNGRSKERKRAGHQGARARSISLESNGNTTTDRSRKQGIKKKKGRERNLSLDSVTSMTNKMENVEVVMGESDRIMDDMVHSGNAIDIMDQDDTASDEQKEDQAINLKQPQKPMMKSVVTAPAVAASKPKVQQRVAAAPLTPTSAAARAKQKNSGDAVSRKSANEKRTDQNGRNRSQKRNGNKAVGNRSNREPMKRKQFGNKPLTVSSLVMKGSRK